MRSALSYSPTFVMHFVLRTAWLLVVSFRFCAAIPFSRLLSRNAGPELLFRYFEACGAGFVKLGQLLAMRYDLLPERYCLRLAALLDELKPLPLEIVVAVVEADLGRPLAEVFPVFESRPLSSASIAQVHRARLSSGARVVVKVKRPRIESQIRVDVAIVRFAAYVFDRLGIGGELGLQRVVQVIAASIENELDFEREARNTEIFHETLQRDNINHCAPEVYLEYCGPRVITMEELQGIPLKDVIGSLRSTHNETDPENRTFHIDPDALALLIFRSMLEQFFNHGIFHADPHAANLLLLEDGRLGWVDFGMVGTLDERVRSQQFRLRECISQGETDAAFQVLLSSVEPLPGNDLWEFESDFKEIVSDWIGAVTANASPLWRRSSGYFLQNLLRAMRRAHISVPVSVVQLYRAILISDAVMLAVSPRVDWVPELGRFIRDEHWRRLGRLWLRFSAGDNLGSIATTGMLVRSAFEKSLIWLSYRLPALSREYRFVLGLRERVLAAALWYARILCWCVALAILAFEVTGRRFEGLPTPLSAFRPWWYWVVGAAVVGAFFMGAMRRSLMREPLRGVPAD